MNYNYLSHAALDLYTPYLLYYEPIEITVLFYLNGDRCAPLLFQKDAQTPLPLSPFMKDSFSDHLFCDLVYSQIYKGEISPQNLYLLLLVL